MFIYFNSCIHIHNWYKLFSPMTDVRVKKYAQMAYVWCCLLKHKPLSIAFLF